MINISTKQRKVKDKLMLWGICFFAALTAVPLFAILLEVLFRGYDQLSWQFFTEPTPTAYKAMKAIEAGEPIPGGIANGIIGTMIILSMAVVVAVPIGILCGAFLAENSKKRYAQVVSYLTDLLQGTPSVIIGIITYIWVVVPMKGYSAIAGSVALAIMMLPLIIRSTEESLLAVPDGFREGSLALGAGKVRTIFRIILPSAASGIVTAVILAVGRIISESAVLILTLGMVVNLIPSSVLSPGTSLALDIYYFASHGYPDEAAATSVVLLLMVILLNLLATGLGKLIKRRQGE